MRRSSGRSYAAAVLTGVLGLTQLWWASGLGAHASATGALLGPLSLVAAVALGRISCFETRLAAVVVAAAQLLLTVLALSIGLPGQPRQPIGVRTTTGLLLPAAILVALELDRRRRTRRARSGTGTEDSPYAR